MPLRDDFYMSDTRSFVDNWVKPNIVPLIGAVVLITVNWVQLNQMRDDFRQYQIKVDSHIGDTLRHIDPVRDARDRDQVLRRLDIIETKIDNLK